MSTFNVAEWSSLNEAGATSGMGPKTEILTMSNAFPLFSRKRTSYERVYEHTPWTVGARVMIGNGLYHSMQQSGRSTMKPPKWAVWRLPGKPSIRFKSKLRLLIPD
jgi:hypothetical protein